MWNISAPVVATESSLNTIDSPFNRGHQIHLGNV
jgi:hypothetical protein